MVGGWCREMSVYMGNINCQYLFTLFSVRSNAPLRSRLRHYSNLSGMAAKLRRLVGEFAWGRMDEVAAREAALVP